MAIVLTKEAAERAQWVVRAAEALHEQARAIAHTCSEAEEDEIIMAAVEQDLSFSGTWIIPRGQMYDDVLHLEDNEGKWVLTFGPLTSVEEIKDRCTTMAHFARKRREAIQRWLNLHR